MANGIIYPPTVYGALNAKYGTNITQYNTAPNTTGFPAGSGLSLGMIGMLFDGTQVQLLKGGSGAVTAAANDFLSLIKGASNFNYNVQQVPGTANTVNLMAVNDRLGGSLAAGDIAWATVVGNASGNTATGLTGGNLVASSAVAGRAGAYTAGTSVGRIVMLANDTSVAGANPVVLM